MAFEEFYQSIYYDIFFKWIILNNQQYSNDHVICEVKEDTSQFKKISFEMDKVIGLVTIWYNNIVEEQISYRGSKDLLFYLHYTIVDLGQAHLLFNEFYHTLLKHNNEQQFLIAICGNDGLSTAIFVEEFIDACQLKNSPICVHSLSLDELPTVYHHYTLLYLAPQIAHLEPELLKLTQHQVPIYSIEPMIFATKDYQSMLKMIMNHLSYNKTRL